MAKKRTGGKVSWWRQLLRITAEGRKMRELGISRSANPYRASARRCNFNRARAEAWDEGWTYVDRQ
jgi:hypothetical protein